MKKKVISAIILVVLILAFLLNYIISYANSDQTIYVNLTKANPASQIGYGINDPTTPNVEGQPAANAYIWNLTTYDYDSINKTYSVSDVQRDLYCVKANYGDTWNTNYSTQVSYNLSYDLENDRFDLYNAIADDADKDIDNIVKTLLTESGYYRELLWILDNAYISGKTDKIEFLSNIGFKYDDEYDVYYYEPIEGYDYSALISPSANVDGYEEEYFITDEDIKAVQRAAIWYYTNYKIDNEAVFNQKGDADWLNISIDNGSTYKQLASITAATTPEGMTRNDQANVLYNYLIDAAEDNVDDYKADEKGNYAIKNAASVNTTGLTQISTNKYKLQATRVGSNYVIGPIVIDKNSNASYNISIAVTNQDGTVSYTYTDVNGTSLGVTDIKALVGRTEGFYISVSREDVEKINVKIEVSQERTQKTLWLTGTEETDATGKITDVELTRAEQPVVEIVRTSEPVTVEFESEPDEFDLALRKYITAVNGTNVANTRVPNIDLSTLQTGTTATYKHRKEPVVVQDKDEVTYILTIYNEGNKAGYASQIIDQLPTGLVSSATGTVWSKDKNGQNKNEYTLGYKASNNQIILTITDPNSAQSLQPYTTGSLDYETIEIKCKVAQEPDTQEQIILTNVAWIAAAYDSESGKEISSEGTLDRDSQPQSSPNVDKDMDKTINYIGNSSNKTDLTDSTYHYEGQQDDDDFEKLVLMPVEKVFDLALFKHIAAISKDQTIENGEYVTDTGNIDGTYLRAPVVTAIDPETGKITYKEDSKEALIVEPGDYVLYTIRVYNEGEINGYASKIKDTLPIGLQFAADNEEYNGIWNLDGYDTDGRQIVSTTWYAKGQGAELNATETDPNYKANLLKALNKEGAISDENPDYLDAQVLCKVVEQATSDRVLVNYAQISDDSDEDGKPIDDIDSTPDEWIDGDDDQDIERIKLQCFDLSLRKFITAINDTELKENGKYTREPVVDVSNLINGNGTTAVYNHPKTPVSVQVGDKVVYTIRVYNEGDFNGYASEVKDYLPVYLQYVDNSEINEQYGWQISDDGRVATTSYLANDELIGFAGTELDYADVKIECLVVNNAPVKQNQTNIAEISEYTYNGTTVPKDIDSTSDNMENEIPTDENLPSYKNDEINKEYVPGNEDDDDFEKVYVKFFDLSLRKFITSVNNKTLNGVREPVVDVTPLKNGADTTAIYKHPKTPVALKIGDKVVYTIRVYNEGEIAGYASEVTDYLPPYLTFVKDSEINEQYGWQISEDGRIATTTYLSTKEISEFNGNALDYEDVKIECQINENAIPNESITNIAEISEYKYGGTVVPEDIDSESNSEEENLPEDKDLPSYKDEELDKEYVPGNEDDDDFEKVYVKEFDLALRKFITKVQENEVTTRVPQVKNENGVISYEHTKDPITLHVGDVVIYTLRIYNEGEIDGYASEITDDIPEYLEYLPEDSTNVEYMWKMYNENGEETENVKEAAKVKTQYLSKENGEDNLIKAFDGTTLDYKNIKIAFKVKDPGSNTYIITNHAQISDDTDEDGNDVKDKDSEPDEWNEGEDDQDIENVKVEYFDLSLLKFVSKVIIIEDGKETISETGYNGHEDPEPVVKVELHKKKLSDVVVKFGYGITITNEGEIAGYATEITDYIPEGLRFDATDNPEWMDEGNNVISTRQLEGTLLQPGESATVEVILTWINGADNLALKTNTAEISEDDNEYGVPDKDSTPDNKQEGEDDIDIAKVILAVSTGAAKTYFTLTLGLLAVVLIGIALIKKFVI